jgi:subtilisin-like proprotein convertase family protein
VVAYLGDTTGNADYSTLDAEDIYRVVAEFDTGFLLYQLLDPVIIGDTTGNGSLSSLDGTRILQEIQGFDRLEIPPLPSLAQPIVFGGLDPTLSVPLDLAAYQNELITVPVWVDTLPVGLNGLQLDIGYDAAVLAVEAVRPGGVTESFEVFLADTSVAGLIHIDTASGHLSTPLEDGGLLVEIDFRILADAPTGLSAIDLQGARLNDGHYVLIPEPVSGPDGTDGAITVLVQPLDTDSDADTEAPVIAATTTYSMDQPVAIPDNGFIAATINVTDAFRIRDIDVELNISHTRVSNLHVVLVSPTGKSIELFNKVGGRGDNFTGTQLDDAGTTRIGRGAAPFTGVFRPDGDLGSLEGTEVQGTWTLEIHDNKKRHTGILDSWSITVTRDSSLLASEAAVESAALQSSLTRGQPMQRVAEGVHNRAVTGQFDTGLNRVPFWSKATNEQGYRASSRVAVDVLPGNERRVDWYSPSSQAVYRLDSMAAPASARSSAYLPLATDGLPGIPVIPFIHTVFSRFMSS